MRWDRDKEKRKRREIVWGGVGERDELDHDERHMSRVDDRDKGKRKSIGTCV